MVNFRTLPFFFFPFLFNDGKIYILTTQLPIDALPRRRLEVSIVLLAVLNDNVNIVYTMQVFKQASRQTGRQEDADGEIILPILSRASDEIRSPIQRHFS